MSVIQPKYTDGAAITLTSLASLASSSSRVAGWTSDWISNLSDLAGDRLISGQIQVNTGSAPTANTSISVYAYAAHNDTPTAPDLFSAGTEGTVGTATVHDEEQRDYGMVHLWSAVVDANTSRIYTMPPKSLLQAFGGLVMPTHIALFVVHNTGQTFSASNQALYQQIVQLEIV